MIYQVNNEFKFFPYKATYFYEDKEKVDYLEDKRTYEKNLMEYIKRDKESKLINVWYSNNPNTSYTPKEIKVNLPEIQYAELLHTKEEKERLERCNNINANLSDVIYYVTKGKYPDKDHSLKTLEIEDLKKENIGLKLGQAQLLEQSLQSKMELSLSMAQIMEQLVNIKTK